jgi:cytochrome c oxidase cbb3-type subunit 4
MKIVSQYLESIAGIEIFPVVSFIIFFLFFLVVTWYVIRLDKNYIEEMANLPGSPESNQNPNDSIHEID